MLRPYQQATLDAIVNNLKAGVRAQLVVWATGTGKTVLAAQLPSVLKTVLPGKLVFVAHTTELLQQAKDKIQYWNPDLKIGLEKAESHAAPDCDVILACNASVGRTGSTRLDSFWDDVSVIVVDECAHILGGSYLKILEDSGVLLPDSKKLLVGLTATPKRHNITRGQKITLKTLDDENLISLKSVFSKIVYSYPLRSAIKDGFLVPLRGYRVNSSASLDDVKVVAGDYEQGQLSTVVNTNERNLLAVRAWLEHAEHRPTACFTVNIAHAQALAKVFVDNNVVASAIWGEDAERAAKLTKFEAGEITVLTSCSVLSEGWDSPRVSCIVLARPTRSGSLMTQQVGRGTRLCEDKTDCIIIDVVDNTKRNSLVTFPSLLGLNPELDLHGESVTEAAETIEALQEKYSGVSLAGLTDITKVKAFVESIDLFHNPYDEDVKSFSKLAWISTESGYSLAIPEKREVQGQYYLYLHEKLSITENELGQHELGIKSTETERILGVYPTLQGAFASGDEVVTRCRADRMKLLVRDAHWHSGPASEAAKKYLRSLTKKKPLLKCLCAGLHPMHGVPCGNCGKETGITAGQAALALNILKTK